MAKIASKFKFGNRENITPEELLKIMEEMYTQLAEAVNLKPELYERETDGQADDTFLPNGSININSTTNKVEILTNRPSSTSVTWTTL